MDGVVPWSPTSTATRMDVSKLLSPPESNDDAFLSRRALLAADHSPQSKEDTMVRLPSPPVTPANRHLSLLDGSPSERRRDAVAVAAADSEPLRDPVLFSSHEPEPAIAADQPLFPIATSPAVATVVDDDAIDPKLDALVTQHMAAHVGRFRNAATKPTRDEYLLALSCIPIVSKRYAENPRRWLQQERRILDERFGGANRVWKRPAHGGLAKLAPAPTSRPTATAGAGVKKQTVLPRAARPPRAPRAPRAPRPPKTATGPAMHEALEGGAGTTGSPSRRVIGTSREDTDFAALPDYAPPLSTLPANNPRILKADWRGQVLDLSNDPHRSLLHEAELHLAATLRLSCATYLCSKRRIFMARLEALRIGKEFRKTDSQQACKIDVNKASKLWTAYDRVGWFNPEHFQQHLSR